MSLFRPAPSIPTVNVDHAASLPADVALVDVRGTDEWDAGHAPLATHVPLDHLHPDALPSARTLYVICRSGNRSGVAVQALQQAGYDAHNVAGGMGAWAQAGHPVVRDDGSAGTVI
jgi:rhodanese-related sulfurtransferase